MDEKEKVPDGSSVENPVVTLENLEYLKYQLPGFNGNQEKNTPSLQNPATVVKIYRNAMKKPGEILISRLQTNTNLNHNK